MEPVLDPSWENPYSPSSSERHYNQHVVRSFAFRRRLPQTVVVAVVVLALIAGVVAMPWLPAVGVLVAISLRLEPSQSGRDLFAPRPGARRPRPGAVSARGDGTQRLRLVTVLDRLAATFGVDG